MIVEVNCNVPIVITTLSIAFHSFIKNEKTIYLALTKFSDLIDWLDREPSEFKVKIIWYWNGIKTIIIYEKEKHGDKNSNAVV